MRKLLKQVLTLSLIAMLFANFILPITALKDEISLNNITQTTHDWETSIQDGSYYDYYSSIFDDDDIVRVSIVLYDPSVVEKYGSEGITSNTKAMSYKKELELIQNNVANMISANILNGNKLDVIWNLTIVINAFSVNVPFGKIVDIYNMPEVKYVVIETTYERAETVESETTSPQMAFSSEIIGGNTAWSYGYTGAGTKIAIIDTGIDTSHISFDSDAYEYAIAQLEEEGNSYDFLTIEDLDLTLDKLHIYLKNKNLTPNDLYISSKIPFAFNYMDNSLDVLHINDQQTDHGSHVAGIAAANRYIKTEKGYENALDTVFVQGVAPDAQLVVMKVFGQKGSPSDSDFLVAIEDAMLLGCEAINLSLGVDSVGMDTPTVYKNILENLIYTDSVVLCAAGNSGHWASTTMQGNIYADDVSLARVSSPSTYTNTLSIASIDNVGYTCPAFKFGDVYVQYMGSTTDNINIADYYGTYDYVYLDSTGNFEDFEKAKDLIKGKFAICNRGDLSFQEKAENAFANGVAGLLIANNTSGMFEMSINKIFDKPIYLISLDDSLTIKNMSEKHIFDENLTYYTGSFTIDNYIHAKPINAEYYTISDFSSWGVPSSMTIKPELSAPGGNIYSVNGLSDGKSYKTLSGTSMATPATAGITALLSQYIRENNLKEKTGMTQRALLTSLLMSTSEPLIEESTGMYYSILAQGAGLVRIDKALNSSTYIVMDEGATKGALDGKVKAEIGEQQNNFNVGFNVFNFSDKPVTVTLDASFFTQDVITNYIPNFDYSDIVYSEPGNPYITSYLSQSTTEIQSNSKWLIQTSQYDFNNDGYWSINDALDLLKYVTGSVTEEDIIELNWNLSIADVDKDGDIDTYDAYLLMDCNSIKINAGEKIHIEGDFEITMDEYLYAENGNYIEGFIFVNEVKNEEDGVNGISHSIPVLGYYGKWSDPSMFDRGSFIEYMYGLEYKTPYYATAIGNKAAYSNAFVINANKLIGSNPVTALDIDENGKVFYAPERYSVKSSDVLSQFNYVQLRNSGASRFVITNSNDEILFEQKNGPGFGLHYNISKNIWLDTKKIEPINYSFKNIGDGEVLTFSFSLATPYDVKNDGNVDWDNLGKGATKSVTVVIDNQAPIINDISTYFNEETQKTEITITGVDNRYIAGASLLDSHKNVISVCGPNSKNGKGDTYTATFEVDLNDENIDGYFILQLSDYAGNIVEKKYNTHPEEFNDPNIQIFTEDIAFMNVAPYATKQIHYSVLPWGIEDAPDYAVYFKTTDPTVAVVSEHGEVTFTDIYNSGSSCEINIIVNAFGKTNTATVNVLTKVTTNNFSGVVYDPTGCYFVDLNLHSLNTFTKIGEKYDKQISSVFYDSTGTKYVSIFTKANNPMEIYSIDESNNTLKYQTTLPFAVSAICFAPTLGSNVILGVNLTNLIVFDITSGEILTDMDLSPVTNNKNLISIAYLTHNDTFMDTATPSDTFILEDSLGYLYTITLGIDNSIYAIEDNIYRFYRMKYSTDKPYLNSMYFDGNNILCSYNEGTYKSRIIMLADINDVQQECDLGTFNDDYSLFTGIFQNNVNPIADFVSHSNFLDYFENVKVIKLSEVIKSDSKNKEDSCLQPIDKGYYSKLVTNETLALGSIQQLYSPNNISSQIVEPEENNEHKELSFKIDKAATNGLITIKFNPEELSFIQVVPKVEYNDYSFDLNNGIITYGFISQVAIEEDEEICQILFELNEGYGHANFTSYNTQLNNDHYEDKENILYGEHKYAEPTWSWSEDYSKATAQFVCEYDETHILNIECDTEVIDYLEATCELSGHKTYKATVKNGDTTYSDTQIETFNPISHDWNTPTYTWNTDHSYVTAKTVCKHDSNHVIKETVKTIELILRDSTCTLEGYVRYKAYFTNEIFTVQSRDFLLEKISHRYGPVIIENLTEPTCIENGSYDEVRYCTYCGSEVSRNTKTTQALGHSYGAPTWTWTDDGKAKITFVCKTDSDHILVVDVNDIKVETKPATALEDGLKTYTATYEFTNGMTYSDTKTVILPKLGPNRELVSVMVDENVLSNNDYSFIITQDGETIVTVNETYLSKLSNGSHTLKIQYVDGIETKDFNTNYQIEETTTTVNESSTTKEETKPNDNSTITIVIVFAIIVLAIATAAIIIIINKKKSDK